MRCLMALALLLAVLLSACSQAGAAPTPTPSPIAATATTPAPAPTPTPGVGPAVDPVIVYVRSGGIAGRTEKWTVYPSGRVEGPGTAERTVAPGRVAAVLAEIKATGFWDLAAAYGAGSPCRDCYNVVLTVREDDMLKQVSAVLEAGDTPAAMRDSVAKVEALVAGR